MPHPTIVSVLLYHLDDLQCRASRVFNKGKLGKSQVCGLDDEFRPFVTQVRDRSLKVINSETNMIPHPSMNLLRDRERQTVQLQAHNRDAAKLHFLDFLGAKRALVERGSLRHIVNDQMPVVKTVSDGRSCG